MDDSLRKVNAEIDELIRTAKDRIRIFTILYVFGEAFLNHRFRTPWATSTSLP